MASLVLHTGWPGLAHRAVKMAARVCISRFLFLSPSLSFLPRVYIIYPRLGQRLDTIVIFIIVVVVVVVVVALSLHSLNHVAN